ncbi:Fic/DOC family protein [Georgenia yuyongxinii]
MATPIRGRFDLPHLQAIHAYLTQDMYVWGGQVRETDTHPGGTEVVHCRPQFITAEGERVFERLAELSHLRGLDADTFSDRFAWVWGEATTIHPFREVNTRSQYVFFDQLAREAGWVIDWAQIPGDVMAHARTLAIVEDHAGIDALIRPNLLTTAEAARLDGLAERLDEHLRGFSTRKVMRDPETLDRELDAARDRRRKLPPRDAFGRGRDPHRDHGPNLGH